MIIRRDQPMVEPKPIAPVAKPITSETLDWLKKNRVGRRAPREDAGTAGRRMRDEGER